ncbi:hypothetical protein [Vitiosangium sp. GDMCC 1.1324]|uniref:hypothetical protein n=1 Tax=Vitiosangium sp. (strain GDMCC 1.1324) TaxID=2138576 RepID=UPI000D389564|nr:hypothetical protein [Vitiosangium sp. GDMCC 1.1324]PTL77094.1 hypothetical protein DAT35_46495 [Vitiosangium sp. GDMCC 1.1324]
MTLKKTMTLSSVLAATLWVALVGGCGGTQVPEEGDNSNLQGDNLNAGDSQDGTPAGNTAPDENGKVTVCHIPPGNPARAHTLIVGQPAVKAHLKHGDTLGPCGGTSEQDGGTTEPDAGGEPGPQPDAGSGTGTPDAGGPTCAPRGSACGADTLCCDGLQCTDGVCTIIVG